MKDDIFAHFSNLIKALSVEISQREILSSEPCWYEQKKESHFKWETQAFVTEMHSKQVCDCEWMGKKQRKGDDGNEIRTEMLSFEIKNEIFLFCPTKESHFQHSLISRLI